MKTAAAVAGVPYTTLAHWLRTEPEFKARMDSIRATVVRDYSEMLRISATGGNVTAITFALSRLSEEFRDTIPMDETKREILDKVMAWIASNRTLLPYHSMPHMALSKGNGGGKAVPDTPVEVSLSGNGSLSNRDLAISQGNEDEDES